MFPPNSDAGTVASVLERVTGCREITVDVDEDGGGWFAIGFAVVRYDREGLFCDVYITGRGEDPRAAGAAFLERNLTWIRHEKMREQDGRCLLCPSLGPLQLEHLVGRAHGRDDRPGNLRLLCARCHDKKTGTLQWKGTMA